MLMHGQMETRMEMDQRLRRIELELEFVIRYVRLVAQELGLRAQVRELETEYDQRLDDMAAADTHPPGPFPEEPPTKP